MTVHVALPSALANAAAAVLDDAGVPYVSHDDGDPVAAAAAAADDPRAVALLGPFYSADVAEALEVTAPAGLPLLAPIATWAGVTRDDEPGCDDAARHRGTVLRMVARDTEVAARLASHLRASGRRALVVAGSHDYGRQLDGQLRLARLPRVDAAADADLIVLCGLAHEAEIDRVRGVPELPLVAFDGVQQSDLGRRQDVLLALPFAASEELPFDHMAYGALATRRAAELVVSALAAGTSDRSSILAGARAAGSFDRHGDPIAPPVWLWRADADWTLLPERPL